MSASLTRLENSYNGLNWRVSKRSDTDLNGSLDEQRVMYYNASWQLVEEEIYEGWTSGTPGVVDEQRAYIWGNRYVDDAVAMFVDSDVDDSYEDAGGGSERYFYLTDAQFSVVAVMDDAANLQEKIQYDAYGRAIHHDWRDTDGDGDYDSTDRSAIGSANGSAIGGVNYSADYDVDRDGDVDLSDVLIAGTSYPTALSRGELSYSGVGNIIGYDGYVFNTVTELYTVRHRTYNTVLGRWLERDPAGYVDGPNPFSYGASAPHQHLDPTGLIVVLIHGVNTSADWYANAKAGLRDYWKDNNLCPQEIIEFRWYDSKGRQGGKASLATYDVDKIQNDSKRQYMWDAAMRMASLLHFLHASQRLEPSDEGVTVIAHSQGTIITLAAMQFKPTATVDNLIMLGSPLAWRNDLSRALRNVRGSAFNYFSPNDEAVNLAGGISLGKAIGSVGASTPGVVDREFGDGETIHGYTLPNGPKPGLKRGLPRHSWYMAQSDFFRYIYGFDVAPTGDGKLSAKTDALPHWRRTADPGP